MTATSSSVIDDLAFAARLTTYAAPPAASASPGQRLQLGHDPADSCGLRRGCRRGRRRRRCGSGGGDASSPPKRRCRKDMAGSLVVASLDLAERSAGRAARSPRVRRAGVRRAGRGAGCRAGCGVGAGARRGILIELASPSPHPPARRAGQLKIQLETARRIRGRACRPPCARSSRRLDAFGSRILRQRTRVDLPGPPIERSMISEAGTVVESPGAADEPGEHVVEDRLDLVAEGVARAPDTIDPEGDVGNEAHDKVVRPAPRPDQGLNLEAMNAGARPEEDRRSCRPHPVGDQDLGLRGQLRLLADLVHEDPQLGLAGRRLVDPQPVVADDFARELHERPDAGSCRRRRSMPPSSCGPRASRRRRSWRGAARRSRGRA